MLELIIGGVKVDEYVSVFRVGATPAGSGGFKNYKGETVSDESGDYISLNIQLSKVPTAVANSLSAALSSDSVPVSYTSPGTVAAAFRKTSFDADSRSRGTTWNISLSLESTAPVGGSCL